MKKFLFLLIIPLVLSGCWWKKTPPSAQSPQNAVVDSKDTNSLDVDLGSAGDLLNHPTMASGGSTYTYKGGNFGFELWHPDAMTVAEHNTTDEASVSITSKDTAASNLAIRVTATNHPSESFEKLPGTAVFVNGALMKRKPIDGADPQKTNTYAFEKNGARVTIDLTPGTTQERFIFPDIIQSFKFTE